MAKESQSYMAAPQDDFEESYLSPAGLINEDTKFKKSRRTEWRIWIIQSAILLSSIVFFVSGIVVRRGKHCPGDWFPLVGHNPPIHNVRFDGRFNSTSPFKGPPSTERDAAWSSILPLGGISIPESVFTTLNASRYASKVPPEAGGGRLGLFEAFHQLHCLQNIWMATRLDYYPEEKKYSEEHSEMWRIHLDHCVDMLRQKLMCDADATLLTYNWVKNHYAPHPNFNVAHKCRDYNRLLEEAAKHRIDGSIFPKKFFERPKDRPVVDFEEPPFDPQASS